MDVDYLHFDQRKERLDFLISILKDSTSFQEKSIIRYIDQVITQKCCLTIHSFSLVKPVWPLHFQKDMSTSPVPNVLYTFPCILYPQSSLIQKEELWIVHWLYPFLTWDAIVTVTHALMISYLDYCNVLYMGLTLKSI